MLTTPEHQPQDFNEDPLLQVFDYLYTFIIERNNLLFIPDGSQEIDKAVLALLTTLLLESEKHNTPINGHVYLEQGHFVLDPEGNITSFSITIPNVLGYPTIRLAQRSFSSLLTETTTNNWEGLLAVIQGKFSFQTVTALTLRALNCHEVPSICSVSKLLNSAQVHITCLFVIQDLAVDPNPPTYHKNIRKDAALLHKLHKLILEHLDRPLPSIPQLAKTLGSNSFTLKDGFKHYFNTGIYQFYTQERLAKAKLMLLETDLPLSSIAEACGFSSASTFSKAFKKKYGMTPLPFKKVQ